MSIPLKHEHAKRGEEAKKRLTALVVVVGPMMGMLAMSVAPAFAQAPKRAACPAGEQGQIVFVAHQSSPTAGRCVAPGAP